MGSSQTVDLFDIELPKVEKPTKASSQVAVGSQQVVDNAGNPVVDTAGNPVVTSVPAGAQSGLNQDVASSGGQPEPVKTEASLPAVPEATWDAFASSVATLSESFHETAYTHGFWPEEELTVEEVTARVMKTWRDSGCQVLSDEDDLRKFTAIVAESARLVAPQNLSEKLMLIVSEVSELQAGLRAGNPASEHIPEFSAAEEEAADVVVRLFDLCHSQGWRLAAAVKAKARFNESRSHRHGKAF